MNASWSVPDSAMSSLLIPGCHCAAPHAWWIGCRLSKYRQGQLMCANGTAVHSIGVHRSGQKSILRTSQSGTTTAAKRAGVPLKFVTACIACRHTALIKDTSCAFECGPGETQTVSRCRRLDACGQRGSAFALRACVLETVRLPWTEL